MTDVQWEVLQLLKFALRRATESGLFDMIPIHPDITNRFCDAVEEFKDRED